MMKKSCACDSFHLKNRQICTKHFRQTIKLAKRMGFIEKAQKALEEHKIKESIGGICDPEKEIARFMARTLLKDKKPCIVCGDIEMINRHHPDYSKPLEIIWLCPSHHSELHQHKRKEYFEDKLLKVQAQKYGTTQITI